MVTARPSHEKYPGLLADIKRGKVKIPQFQRDFVWTLRRSAELLDSIVKGYPVGTFIFWHTTDRLRSVRDIGGTNLPEPPDGHVVAFVLDGQQRITSLYAALEGKNVVRQSGAVDDFTQIYVDLEASEHDPIVITDPADLDPGTYIQLSALLQGGLQAGRGFDQKYYGKIDEYRDRLRSYDFPIVGVSDAEIDVATEIFTRINVGGKSLTTYEIMAAKTYDEPRDFNLVSKFEDLIGRLDAVGYETVADITPLQLISLIVVGECKKESILRLKKDEFIDSWGGAVDAIEHAVDYFRTTFAIPVSRLLPYNALVIPFAYFFYLNKGKRPTSMQAAQLEDFFWRCSLGGRYSSSLESKLAQDKLRIDQIYSKKTPDYDWAVDTSPEFLMENGWFSPNRSFVKAILCLYASFQPRSFESNALVNIGNSWLKQANSKNYHHFFPKSYLKKTGVSDNAANNVLNITIVDDYLNKRQIRADAPSKYMKKFSASNPDIEATMNSHLIGDFKTFGFMKDDYEKFLKKRADRVSEELSRRITSRPIDSSGQSMRVDDFDASDPDVDTR